jgi:hypothetical protein
MIGINDAEYLPENCALLPLLSLKNCLRMTRKP